jgi:hypothetical protein
VLVRRIISASPSGGSGGLSEAMNAVRLAADGYPIVVPLIVKGLLILAKSRRGRKLLLFAALAVTEIVQGKLRRTPTRA